MNTIWNIFSDIFLAIFRVGSTITIFGRTNLWEFLFGLIVIGSILSTFLAYVVRSDNYSSESHKKSNDKSDN